MEKSTKTATFVRCGFTLLAILLGLTGLSLLLYGGIRVYNVDLTNAERDDLAGYPVSTDSDTYVRVGGLAPFLSCDDLVNAASWEATDTSKSYSQYQNVFRRVCLAPKLPAMILLALSSSFLLAALCLGVTSSLISRGRWHQYLFAIVCAMTFALVIGCCIYYIIQTIGTETRLVECDGLEANAIKKITEIQKGLLVTCINGANSVAGSDNRTAYDWLFHLHLFYAGVATSLTSVFILIILTTWASHRSDKHLMKKIATGIPIGYDDETILDERLLQ